VRDEVIYRCVNMACARSLPRRVNFCPYCGVDQRTALPRAEAGEGVPLASPVGEAVRATVADVSDHFVPPPRASSNSTPAPPAAMAPPATSAAMPPVPAPPPRRQPVRLRWWLLALGALWLIWIMQRPTVAKLDARVDKAVALAVACKANDAQSELIALRKLAATPAQLARLQAALDEADSACRRPARGKPASKSARSAAAPSLSQSPSVRNLVADARASLARGDYRAAADKMEVCVAMVDANTRECSELKVRAERLDGERGRCEGQGGAWMGDSCRP